MNSKKVLLQRLLDTDESFTVGELDEIIYNEFFNSSQPMDSDVVDAALSRRMQLNGIVLDDLSVQKERERMIYEVLKEVFRANK